MKYNIQSITLFVLVLSFSLFTKENIAQYDEVQKLIEPPAFRDGGEAMGGSVDVEGDYGIVSMIGDNEDANNQNPLIASGTVNIYKRLNYGNWIKLQKLSGSDRGNADAYGTGVVVSGNEAFVSATLNKYDSLNANPLIKSGAVFIYKRVNDVYSQTQKIVAPDRNGEEEFGSAIDVYQNWLIVGALNEDKNIAGVVGGDAGALYVYKKNIGTGNWDFYQKIISPNRHSGDNFGFDCSIDEDVIVVGANRNDYDENELNSLSNSGSAYVYRFVAGSWVFEQKLIEPLGARSVDNNFGNSVDVSDGVIVVGSPNSSIQSGFGNLGRVIVFNFNSSLGFWNNTADLEFPNALGMVNGNRTGNFGFSLDLTGDKLLVGAPGETNIFAAPPYGAAGSAFLYQRAGNTFVLSSENNPLIRVNYAVTGFSVALDSNTLYLGAPGPGESSVSATFSSQLGDSAGAAYIFEQCIHANIPQVTSTTASTICQGDSVQLVINPANTLNSSQEWYWYTGSYATGALVDSTDTIWVSPTITTTYSIAGEGYCVGANLSDSVGTITVTVIANPTVTANSSPGTNVCLGESVTLTGIGASTYVWDNSVVDGVSFPASAVGTTTYKVVGTTTNGCVDSTTIDVIVSTTITVGIDYTGNNPICSGTPITLTGTGASTYTWNPAIINGAAFTPLVTTTYTVTGTSTTGCSATADTTITVVAGPSISTSAGITTICQGESVTISATGTDTYAWVNIGAGQSQNVSPSVTTMFVVTGTQTSTMCTDTDSIEITVNQLPVVVANAQPNDSLCLGESLILTSGAPNPVWNNGIIENIIFTPNLGSVDYIVTSTDVNGCTNGDTINVKVFNLPIISASGSSTGAICYGNLVTLNGFGGVNYVWDSLGTLEIINGVPFAPPLGNNIFNVTGTDINGCTATAVTSLIVHDVPSVSAFLSTGTATLCDGDVVNLTPTGNGMTYSWSPNVTSGVDFAPPIGTTIYTVTATSANQCESTASVSVVVNVQEDATIDLVDPLCGDAVVETLMASTSGGVWQGVGVDPITGEFDAGLSGVGLHQVIYTTSGMCNDSDTIYLEVYPELVVNTYGDTVCFGDQDGEIRVEVIQGVTPYSYLWDNDETTSAISELGEGVYSIEIKDGNNCIVNLNVDVLLTESCDYHLFLPNVFSPNGDGSNDVFYARGKGFESLTLQVFDRWGNRVFETVDKYKGWDGRFNGKVVDSGVYVYYVKVVYYDGVEEVIEGNICVAY